MTPRSTRRAAEMAVIDAAITYVHEPVATSYTYGVLGRAVREYEALGLDTTSQATFSNNSTDTSSEAGASMAEHVGQLAQLCYDEILVSHRNNGVGLTVDALEQILARSHQSVSARVNELRNKGWVTDSGIRRATRSGRSAIVWRPTSQALNR